MNPEALYLKIALEISLKFDPTQNFEITELKDCCFSKEKKSGYSNGCYRLARTRAANNLSGQSLNELVLEITRVKTTNPFYRGSQLHFTK